MKMSKIKRNLKDYHVDENKVWFTGGYWPEGVPHQISEIPDINIEPLHKQYLRIANELNTWDTDICIFE